MEQYDALRDRGVRQDLEIKRRTLKLGTVRGLNANARESRDGTPWFDTRRGNRQVLALTDMEARDSEGSASVACANGEERG